MTTIIYTILIIGLLIAGLNIIPDTSSYPLPTEITTAIFYFVGLLKSWNWLLPITTLLQCLGIILGYELLIWAWFKVLSPLIKFLHKP